MPAQAHVFVEVSTRIAIGQVETDETENGKLKRKVESWNGKLKAENGIAENWKWSSDSKCNKLYLRMLKR